MPASVGLTVIEFAVSPVLHSYSAAPETIRTASLPEQIVVVPVTEPTDPERVRTGKDLTTTVDVAVYVVLHCASETSKRPKVVFAVTPVWVKVPAPVPSSTKVAVLVPPFNV